MNKIVQSANTLLSEIKKSVSCPTDKNYILNK